jgi:3-methyl-2-oxobutanoate hydroxymethyltransferase
MDINDFLKMKLQAKPIKMITCYDYWSSKILAETNIDCILVGDSALMVMHGYDSTISANVEMIEIHIKAVKKGINNKFIIGDMPFLSYRKSDTETMYTVEKLMKAGANSIKLEGLNGNQKLIKHITNSGVPVMADLGFTPQSINVFGNQIVQEKEESKVNQLIEAEKELEGLGCFAIVLECIPNKISKRITETLSIPTIGIGAGLSASGQVLVLQDLLGCDPKFHPKFLKKYLNLYDLIKKSVNDYCKDVDNKTFPSCQHSYGE